jgi:hypothetical protein
MLTQELDCETERYLADILAQQRITSDELIRQLIRDRWLLLRQPEPNTPSQSKLQEPTLRSGSVKPKNHKQQIAEFVRRKNQHVSEGS